MKHFTRLLALPLLCACMLLASAHAAQSEAPSVSTSLSKAQALVGEPVLLNLSIKWSSPVRVPEVTAPKKLGSFDVIQTTAAPDQKAPDGSFSRVVTIRLASFELGKQPIPAFDVPFIDAAGKSQFLSTAPQSVEVASVLTKDNAALRPIKPPLRWAMPLQTILLIAAAVLLALTLLCLLIWHLRRNRAGQRIEGPIVPLLPPDEEALRALAELELSGMVERDSAKSYYSRLSEILRRYLGRRYDFDALEMTSSELLEKVERLGWSDGLYEKIAADAAESDGVKFARYVPTQPKRAGALERVREVVIATRPAPPIAEEGK